MQMVTPVCLEVGENNSVCSDCHVTQAFAEMVPVHQLGATLERTHQGAGQENGSFLLHKLAGKGLGENGREL